MPQASDATPLLGAFWNTLKLDAVVTAENGGFKAPALHPCTVCVAAQAVIVGVVVSFTLIVWLQVVEFPHASDIVHVLVTTIGHVPLATSLYVTEVTPHASEVLPWLVAFSNWASLEDAVVDENGGSEMAPELQP